jgi:hypothetical protein
MKSVINLRGDEKEEDKGDAGESEASKTGN